MNIGNDDDAAVLESLIEQLPILAAHFAQLFGAEYAAEWARITERSLRVAIAAME